jgi:molybdopterin-dependent oxidoreductase alpha subunit
MDQTPSFKPYKLPSGGWGSAKSVQEILRREGIPVSGALALTQQNKPDGFQCVSCAWIKPADPLALEFCENGVKATAWDITTRRAKPEFFTKHTVTELLGWTDYDLEQAGRLTRPMRYDPVTDRYREVSWEVAFAEIGRELRAIPNPNRAVFYSSGRTSNEASYLYGLFARLYGTNNLPDSSNMCHETTSVALPESIGVPVGTVTLDDFAKTDCIFFFGQNPGSNAPRMLHPLQEASERGASIITFNPLRERGLESFTNPQSPVEMLTMKETRISSSYHQVKTGGDLAAIAGICKALVEMDDEDRAEGGSGVLDHGFIAEHTTGIESFVAWLRAQEWDELERRSGLQRPALEGTAATYAHAKAAIGVYGMGLTQHRAGVETVQMLVNLLLLRGNIGREGAGISPIRGHSNVQGQRTVGITEKPELVPNDILRRQYGFEPPMEEGLATVDACEAILKGEVDAFVMLGGNFVRAIPDRERMEAVWRNIRLTVSVATKINRSHLLPGTVSYVLPVLSRIERHAQASGDQLLSMEDTSSCIHASRGVRAPASKHLRSEVEIICRIAMATLDPNPLVPWQDWMDDYDRIRDAIGVTYPAIFHDYNKRMNEPGGFHKPLPARQREWHTKTGRALIITPKVLEEDLDMPATDPDTAGHDVLRMMTLRSNDQFNTTIYGYDDRFRGIKGTRMVVLMNLDDMARLGLGEGETVSIVTASNDGHHREMSGFRVTPYNLPEGCIGTYYPETNALVPLGHYAEGSKTPASKNIPVRIRKAA